MKAITVSEYMTRQLVTFTRETSLFEAMGVMLERRVSGAPVVDDAGTIIGVISEIDFLDAMLKGAYGELEGAVGDYMTHGAETIDAQMNPLRGRQAIYRRRRRRLPWWTEDASWGFSVAAICCAPFAIGVAPGVSAPRVLPGLPSAARSAAGGSPCRRSLS